MTNEILETIITEVQIFLHFVTFSASISSLLLFLLQLAPVRLNRYHDDLLFYLYYINGGDLMQILAAAEL